MLKPNVIMPAIILCLICLVTTGLLALTYDLTKAERDRQVEIAANANRLAMYPDAASFESLDLTPVSASADGLTEAYRVLDSGGGILGYLFVSQKRGYAGQVPVILAVGPTGLITGARVLSNEETPGLGKKVANEPFIGQFIGKPAGSGFTLKSAGAGEQAVDAIAGATISSRAVTEAINTAIRFYQDLEKEGN